MAYFYYICILILTLFRCMSKGKILFISQEISPYLPSTHASDLGRKIPQAMQEKGFEVRTFMPRYGVINERRNQLHEVIRLSGMNIVIDDNDHPLIIKVASLQPSRMQVYFIDSDDYFHRSASTSPGLETQSSPEDNDERSMFYARGVLETVKKLRWEPAVVQCSGWITALVPLYLKKLYAEDPSFRAAKVVLSLGSDTLPASFDPRFMEKLKMDGFAEEDLAPINNNPADIKALTGLALRYADAVVQSEPDVDPELIQMAKDFGKPFLPFPDNDFAVYADFYASVLG